ncbi:MAG: hypothetical protein IPN53_04295 [Comamonadaceae bacterium]|nr:hypothetical protein [Comamonadaceae bacterium]
MRIAGLGLTAGHRLFCSAVRKARWTSALDAACPQRATDLVFLIDATGSTADEIDKLKTLAYHCPARWPVCLPRPGSMFWSGVFLRQGVTSLFCAANFTNDLRTPQGVLNQLRRGWWRPEAMNEALHATIHSLSWRGNTSTTRMVFL